MSGHDASGHLHVSPESKAPYAADVLEELHADAAEVIARYPQKRSALLPLLHLVQSVDGYVAGRGVSFCAEVLDLTEAEVSGVATFYTQYKRHPNGDYTVGVCTNTLCAVMGGDLIFDRRLRAPRHRSRRDDRGRQDHPRARRVQRRVRLRAGRHGQLGVLRQPDAREHDRPRRGPARRQGRRPDARRRPRSARSRRSRGSSRASRTAAPTRAWAPVRRRCSVCKIANDHGWVAPGANSSNGSQLVARPTGRTDRK